MVVVFEPQRCLADYAGILQADAYSGYNRLYAPDRSPGPITEAACWSHGRRKFFVLADIAANARERARGKASVIALLALEAVKRIDVIFDLEREINGSCAQKRLAIRRERVAPLVASLEEWMRAERARLSRHSDVAKAMDYMLKRWSQCCAYAPTLCPVDCSVAKPHIIRAEYPSLHVDDDFKDALKAHVANELRALEAQKPNAPETGIPPDAASIPTGTAPMGTRQLPRQGLQTPRRWITSGGG